MKKISRLILFFSLLFLQYTASVTYTNISDILISGNNMDSIDVNGDDVYDFKFYNNNNNDFYFVNLAATSGHIVTALNCAGQSTIVTPLIKNQSIEEGSNWNFTANDTSTLISIGSNCTNFGDLEIEFFIGFAVKVTEQEWQMGWIGCFFMPSDLALNIKDFAIEEDQGVPILAMQGRAGLSSSVTSITNFQTLANTLSTVQSFSVNGTGLSNDLVVSTNQPFEISLDNSTGFSTSFTVTPTAGNISNLPVFVRYAPTTGATHAGSITIQSDGFTNLSLSLQGNSKQLLQTLTQPLSVFNTSPNTPSTVQSFTLTGSLLTAPAIVTAPKYFELKTQNLTNFANTLTVTATANGSLSEVVSIRYTPPKDTIVRSAINITSENAVTRSVNVTGRTLASGFENQKIDHSAISIYQTDVNTLKISTENSNILFGKQVKINLIDMVGKEIDLYHGQLHSSYIELDLSPFSLQKGLYLFKLFNEESVFTKSLFIDRNK